MSKHTAVIFLGILVAVLPVLGFPSWARTTLLVLSGLSIVVLGYLSSVVYCSHCKKLISDVERETYGSSSVGPSRGANIAPSYIDDADQALPPSHTDDVKNSPQP